MAWTPLQAPATNALYNVYAGTLSRTFSSPPAIGDVVIATGGSRSDVVTWDVTDNYSNGPSAHYSIYQTGNSQPFSAFVAFAVVTTTGASFTVTAASTAGQQAENLDIELWSGGSGAGVLDASSLGSYQLNVPTTASVTTTEAGDLLISSFVDSNAVTLTTPPSGYTSMMAVSTATSGHGSAYKIAGAAGSETVTWPEYSGTGYTRAVLVALKAGASGPTVTGVTQTSGGTEGSPAVMTVSLSGATSGSTNFAATLVGVTATGSGTDFTSDLASATYSNGVTFSGGNMVVPDAVSGWTVTIATTSDTLDEANETATLTVGGTAGTLTITDDDAAPTITGTASSTVTAGDPVVITYSPGLSGQTRTYTLALTDGTAVGGTDYDNTTVTGDFAVTAGTGSVSISGSTVTVDPGVTEFTLTIGTTA